MLNETVQLKAEYRAGSKEIPIVGHKNGRPVFAGRLDTTPSGVVRLSELITQFALRAEREGWPGW